MALKEAILEFDKRAIAEEEIVEHVQHYYDLARKGMNILDEDKASALKCLREIRLTMTEEYKYYNKSKVRPFISADHLYNTYHAFIIDAFAKQNSPNSYEYLSSNLYDVMDYARRHFRKHLNQH